MDDPSSQQYLDGTCLLIDKPLGWTSFDVVNKVRGTLRYKLGQRNIKVGHAGTLDPMATGLLLVCTGKFTKKLVDFQGLDKEYTGTFTIGATTPSFDTETEPDAIFPIDHITPTLLEQARLRFMGAIEQLPPMYSAIKVDGQPLYKMARKGQTIEVLPRPVTIHAFEMDPTQLPVISFRVVCSKGTYIRSLAHDFGKAIGSGAHLSSLRRTKIGDFNIENAWSVEALVAHIKGNV